MIKNVNIVSRVNSVMCNLLTIRRPWQSFCRQKGCGFSICKGYWIEANWQHVERWVSESRLTLRWGGEDCRGRSHEETNRRCYWRGCWSRWWDCRRCQSRTRKVSACLLTDGGGSTCAAVADGRSCRLRSLLPASAGTTR